MTSAAGGSPDSGSDQGDNSHKKWWKDAGVLAAGAMLGAAVIQPTLEWLFAEDPPSEAPEETDPPDVRIDKVRWTNDSNQFEITGVVENRQPDQQLWFLNQNASEPNSPLFLGQGPCRVEEAGQFSCRYGYAGSDVDEGARFTIWVAVVTQQQGGEFTRLLSTGGDMFGNPELVLHVPGARTNDGESTLVGYEIQRPIAPPPVTLSDGE